MLREEGLGVAFFRSKFLTDNVKGIYTFTQDFNKVSTLIPPMTWAGKRAPLPATAFSVKRGMTADQLAWSGARDNSDGNYLLYNIYASDSYPVDINDARNLLLTRQRETVLTVPHKGKILYYAVTAVDRYGNESAAVMTKAGSGRQLKPIDFRRMILGNPQKSTK